MDIDLMKEKLRSYGKKDMIITPHARVQAAVREITDKEVKENISNPKKLVYYEEQEAVKRNEKKYDCYFAISDNMYHRYIVSVNGKLIIVTIIGVNRSWQRIVEGKK